MAGYPASGRDEENLADAKQVRIDKWVAGAASAAGVVGKKLRPATGLAQLCSGNAGKAIAGPDSVTLHVRHLFPVDR